MLWRIYRGTVNARAMIAARLVRPKAPIAARVAIWVSESGGLLEARHCLHSQIASQKLAPRSPLRNCTGTPESSPPIKAFGAAMAP